LRLNVEPLGGRQSELEQMEKVTARDTLREILILVCQSNGSSKVPQSQIARFLAPGTSVKGLTFPSSYSHGSLDIKQFKLSGEIAWEDQAKVLVTREGHPLPWMAHLELHQGQWCLRSFLFQCPGCFGSGVIVDEPCGCCGAKGWGGADF
jgi:hypothetical protein